MYRFRVMRLKGPTDKGINMVVFRGRKDLVNKVDNRMTTSAKFTNDFKLVGN
jgi:hypothetical protein